MATSVAALGLRHQLAPALPPGYPFITFFPAVILTGFLAGLRAGLLCAILSGLAVWYVFLPPANSFALDRPTAIALSFYVFIVGIDLALIHVMQRATDRLSQERAVSAALAEQQRTLFQELQHRVANNMTFVASLLHLHRRKIAADPSTATAALDEAGRRIDLMARIHRRLYDPAAADLPVGTYFQEVARDLLDATGARNIVVLADMPAIRLDIARLMVLSLLVVEVVTNSLKHAWEHEQAGTITLKLERLAADRLRFTVADDGKGFAEGAAAASSPATGLGRRICEGLAAQLDGALTVTSTPGRGTITTLSFAG